MFCRKCGAKINDGSEVCGECGARYVKRPLRGTTPTQPDKTQALIFGDDAPRAYQLRRGPLAEHKTEQPDERRETSVQPSVAPQPTPVSAAASPWSVAARVASAKRHMLTKKVALIAAAVALAILAALAVWYFVFQGAADDIAARGETLARSFVP